MKNLIILLFGVTLLFAGCSEDNLTPSDQPDVDLKSTSIPIPNVVGISNLTYSPTSPTNLWNGTIDFGDYGEYSIAFFTLTPPRDYSQAYPFEEDFIIYKLGTDWNVSENVVMKGSHKGVLVFANKMPEPVSVKANGKITEAYAPFEMCVGRTAHSWSTVYFTLGPAPIAIGGVRIN